MLKKIKSRGNTLFKNIVLFSNETFHEQKQYVIFLNKTSQNIYVQVSVLVFSTF